MILQPMAVRTGDAVWSMGDDTPLKAFLARSPRPVYALAWQRFAQVTKSATSIRCARRAWMSLLRDWAPGPICWIKTRRCQGFRCRRHFFRWGRSGLCGGATIPLKADDLAELPCVFSRVTLAQALDDLRTGDQAGAQWRADSGALGPFGQCGTAADSNGNGDRCDCIKVVRLDCARCGACGGSGGLPEYSSRSGVDRIWRGGGLSVVGAGDGKSTGTGERTPKLRSARC